MNDAPGRGVEFTEWGPEVETKGLKDLYAPQEVNKYTVPPPGIDNLALSARDTFFVPGQGDFEVQFEGYFRVARAEPTGETWDTASVFVNMIDIYLEGDGNGLGQIKVRRNPGRVSPGQTFPAVGPAGGQKCRIAAAATFEAPGAGLTLFNKEPILLMNDSIESIPPVEDRNGSAFIYQLPLYDVERPDDKPAAYLTSLRYTVGDYITEDEAERFRARAAGAAGE